MNTEKEKPTTDFQGAISLEAILAANSNNSKSSEKKLESPDINKTSSKIDEKIIEEDVETELKEEVKEDNQFNDSKGPSEESTQEIEENSDSYETALRLIQLGLLEDFKVQISEEDEEGILISELKDMTEENLQEIVSIQKEDKKNQISTKYISKEGLKEHQLKVIEILQNGGDLSKIAETPDKAFERPFEGFDLDEQQRQIDILYTDLVSGKNLDHDSAITLIDKEIKAGTLKNTATKVFDMYRDAHSKYIDEKLKEQRKEREFKELNFKENKKALVAKLKEAGLKESVYKKVSSEYSKKNNNGEYALVDKLKDILEKPEENYELILHLTDEKLFKEVFKIKASNDTQRTIVKLATGTTLKGNKKSVKSTRNINDKAPWLLAAEIHNNNLTNQK